MKWNDLTLIFLWIFLVCMTVIFWQNRLSEELFYEKLLIDRNLDTIAEDCLYASIEGIREDFEPIINTEYLLEIFEKEKNWIFGKGKVEVPLLFLTEKEQENVYRIYEDNWKSYLISGYKRNSDTYTYAETLTMEEAILRTDEIQEILYKELHREPNIQSSGKQYQIYLPYIEGEDGVQKIEKTGFWYFFSSRTYWANGNGYGFFTYSGARSVRKNRY